MWLKFNADIYDFELSERKLADLQIVELTQKCQIVFNHYIWPDT